jgi:hypothetical protein
MWRVEDEGLWRVGLLMFPNRMDGWVDGCGGATWPVAVLSDVDIIVVELN